jgi:hypothetical protein
VFLHTLYMHTNQILCTICKLIYSFTLNEICRASDLDWFFLARPKQLNL